MTVTSDCGIENKPGSGQGFAGPVGVEVSEMPERIAARVAVGADRDPVETDWERVAPGYVLVEPSSLKESYLVGTDKEIVASYSGDYYPKYTQILPNGHRLYSSDTRAVNSSLGAGGSTGCIEEYDANGDLVWRLNLNDAHYRSHHAVRKLDNGNVLALVWEMASSDDAISQGRDPEYVSENGEFWFEGIVEVNPFTLEIVWEWSIRHHLIQEFDIGKSNYGVVADHPELMDINHFLTDDDGDPLGPDWTHANALDHNPELDQISRLYKINERSCCHRPQHDTCTNLPATVVAATAWVVTSCIDGVIRKHTVVGRPMIGNYFCNMTCSGSVRGYRAPAIC